jgi:hypothetical protein
VNTRGFCNHSGENQAKLGEERYWRGHRGLTGLLINPRPLADLTATVCGATSVSGLLTADAMILAAAIAGSLFLRYLGAI